MFRLTHHERNKVLASFIFKLDRRGNKTQAAEQLARPASVVSTIGISDPAVSYYKGTWNTVGSYKVTTQFSSAMTITFTGNEVTLTMGTGTDHGIYDIYIDGSLWESFDGYTTSGIDRLINIYLDKSGSHTIDIQNRAEKNKNSSGYSLRFKQLVVLSTTYDIQTIDYTYDALARLLTGSYSGLTPTRNYTYAYDRSGNRIQQVVNIGGSPTTTNYGYNAANQLISDGVHTLTYDNNGNLRSDGTNTHTWNRANRLTSLGSTSYVYDGEGHRIQQMVGASVTKYLLDLQPGLAVALSETTGANVTRYVHGTMGVQARKDPTGNWFWSLQDALGSVRSEVSNAVAVQGMRHFDPIGNAFGLQGSFSGMPYEFTGEPKDSDGLLYLHERYLNTQLGIFTRLDPFEGITNTPMSLNRYSYVEGNLPNAVDPSGMWGESPSMYAACVMPISFMQSDLDDKCECYKAIDASYKPCVASLANPAGYTGMVYCDGTRSGTPTTPTTWSCVANCADPSFYMGDLWTCSGQGCQEWLDEAHCVLKYGTPNHPSTPLTQWYADEVIYNNAVARPILRVGIDFDSNTLGADTQFAGYNISLPTVYLRDQDYQSDTFLSHVTVWAHESWHSIQAHLTYARSIIREVEAYNVQTLIGRDLGLVNWDIIVTALTNDERDYFFSLGLPTPFGTGITRDYCKLCKAFEILADQGEYATFPLIGEPMIVTSLVCKQYNCPDK